MTSTLVSCYYTAIDLISLTSRLQDSSSISTRVSLWASSHPLRPWKSVVSWSWVLRMLAMPQALSSTSVCITKLDISETTLQKTTPHSSLVFPCSLQMMVPAVNTPLWEITSINHLKGYFLSACPTGNSWHQYSDSGALELSEYSGFPFKTQRKHRLQSYIL